MSMIPMCSSRRSPRPFTAGIPPILEREEPRAPLPTHPGKRTRDWPLLLRSRWEGAGAPILVWDLGRDKAERREEPGGQEST